MIKYALINKESIVIDILEVIDRDTLDGYVLPEYECALIYINDMQTPSIGQVWNAYENKFE
jgi:hypothetical protein